MIICKLQQGGLRAVHYLSEPTQAPTPGTQQATEDGHIKLYDGHHITGNLLLVLLRNPSIILRFTFYQLTFVGRQSNSELAPWVRQGLFYVEGEFQWLGAAVFANDKLGDLVTTAKRDVPYLGRYLIAPTLIRGQNFGRFRADK
jgi:hypothetical protein